MTGSDFNALGPGPVGCLIFLLGIGITVLGIWKAIELVIWLVKLWL